MLLQVMFEAAKQGVLAFDSPMQQCLTVLRDSGEVEGNGSGIREAVMGKRVLRNLNLALLPSLVNTQKVTHAPTCT